MGAAQLTAPSSSRVGVASTRPATAGVQPAPPAQRLRSGFLRTSSGQLQRLPSLRMQSDSSGAAATAKDVDIGSSEGRQYDELVEDLTDFLRRDLVHLFDDQGIDKSMYDTNVVFEDPITKYNNIDGYLFNISFLRRVFDPTFTLHDVRRTGPLELTTRWTMSMHPIFASKTPLKRLWDPTLVFTGTSIMGINPDTCRFRSHVDTWDAVQQQRFFSMEAFTHMLGQVGDWRQGPQGAAAGDYVILRKAKDYEVRRYSRLPAGAAEFGGSGADDVAASSRSGKTAEGGTLWAVRSFSGDATQQAAAEAERGLRAALLRAQQRPAAGRWLLVRGGGNGASGSSWRWRNEVLIPLESFELW